MHSLKAALIIGLAVTGTSCSSTDSTSSEPGGRPEWADGTDWRGTVTMKTGAILAVTFHLETRAETAKLGTSKQWMVIPSPARIENTLTGAGGSALGWGFENVVNIDFMTRDIAIDGSVGCIENAAWHLRHFASLQMAADGNLKGNLRVICVGPGTEIDSQPIVVRRVTTTLTGST